MYGLVNAKSDSSSTYSVHRYGGDEARRPATL